MTARRKIGRWLRRTADWIDPPSSPPTASVPSLLRERRKNSCEPATSIIERCGGGPVVAATLGLDLSTVSRWRMPYPDGTGGAIPGRHWPQLCVAFGLTWDDFKPPVLADTS